MTKQTLDLELEESSDSDSLHKNAYNWNFKQDDWFLDVVLSNKESFYKIDCDCSVSHPYHLNLFRTRTAHLSFYRSNWMFRHCIIYLLST